MKPPSPDSWERDFGERGATLIEMMVVIGLLALTTGLVFPAMQGPRFRLQTDLAKSQLRADLRAAAATAIATGREVDFTTAPDGSSYAWAGHRRRLPTGAVLLADAPVVFMRDDEAQGGAMTLITPTGRYPFVVGAATGLLQPQAAP